MTTKEPLWGKSPGADPLLLDNQKSLERLSLAETQKDFLYLYSPSGRLITIANYSKGRGPDRILVSKNPSELFEEKEEIDSLTKEGNPIGKTKTSRKLAALTWGIKRKSLFHGDKLLLSLEDAPKTSSDALPGVSDYPGHMRNIFARLTRTVDLELKKRVLNLSTALKSTFAEAVEIPLIEIIGFGKGKVPAGDAALCGILLTGKAFSKGIRMRVDWVSRLSIELRRFTSRTSKRAAAFLRYAVDGRTTLAQERLLEAMIRDFEALGDVAAREVMDSPDFPGTAFLVGSLFALDIIRQDMEATRRKSAGFKSNRKAIKLKAQG